MTTPKFFTILIATLLCTSFSHAKRLDPNRVVDGTYKVIKYKSGTKMKASTYDAVLSVNRNVDSTFLQVGDYRYQSNTRFTMNQDVKQKPAKKMMLKTNTPSKANSIATPVASCYAKVNRFEKKGDTLKLYQNKVLMMVLLQIDENSRSNGGGLGLRSDDGSPLNSQQIISGDGKQTTWRIIQQMEGGQMVERNTLKTHITLGEKEYTASTGCNNMGGTLQIVGSKIKFSNPISTKMYCKGEAGNAEKYLAANLEVADSYRIESNHMYINNSKGDMILMLERVSVR